MNRIILSCLFICSYCSVYACTGCGTSSCGGGIGLLNSSPRSLIFTSWNRTEFTSNKQTEHDISDILQTWNIAFKYQINDKVSIIGSQSYKFNIRREEEISSNAGFGDTQIIGQYSLVDKLIGVLNYRINAGAGIQLPLGQYDEDIHSRNLPENFNAGTGCFAGIFQLNVNMDRGSTSVFVHNNFQYNLASRSGYIFGNQFVSKSTVFQSFQLPKSNNIITSLGVQYERISSDHYKNKKEVDGTGGSGIFAAAGAGFQSSNWQINIEALIPIKSTYVSNEMKAGIRTNLEFVYFLN